MKLKERIRAVVQIKRRKAKKAGDIALIPAAVRRTLGARAGDSLVIEEGCEAVVQRAALRGKYFVVTVEPAPPEESLPKAMDEASAALDSFAYVVQRKREERSNAYH